MVSFSEEQREAFAKLVDMLDIMVGLYNDARAHLDAGDNRAAERRLDAATKIADNIVKLGRL